MAVDTTHEALEQKYVEAKAAAAELARKEGTPDYDPRAHQAAIERERKAKEALATAR
jgi:hypothetical protein